MRYKRLDCLTRVFASKFFYFRNYFGPPTRIPAAPFLKWFSICHAVSSLI